MDVIADLHIHSRFSRATSKDISIKNLSKYGRLKGVSLLGTGDFTHPGWRSEIKKELSEDGTGVLRSRDGFPFLLSCEISSIYTQDGAVRRIHNLVLSPDLETAEQIADALEDTGVNLKSDGRPICGIPSPELVEIIRGVNEKNEVIPAHIWTPWFSLFGSKSGFGRIEDCFQDQTKHIHALETGLSSDPAMNWKLSSLDRFSLVSFSDSHSFWPWRIGREATMLDLKELCYENVVRAIRTGNGLGGTIEVDPSYGKYHYDGHRRCGVSLNPKEAEKHNGLCPVCGNPLTTGVLHRVLELADRKEGYRPEGAKPFYSMLPLSEIISHALGTGVNSKRVWKIHRELVKEMGTEMGTLLRAKRETIERIAGERIADYVLLTREGRINVRPGYDGVYGRIEEVEKGMVEGGTPQKTISDFG